MPKILNVPNLRQAYNFDCGLTAMQAVLAYYGVDLNSEQLRDAMRTDLKKGTPISAFEKAAKKFGLKIKIEENMTINQLKKYIDEKRPIIVAMQAWPKKRDKNMENCWDEGHYAVVTGYGKNKLYFEDPACVIKTYLPISEFKKLWHDMSYDKRKFYYLGMTFYGKKPFFNPRRIISMDWNAYKKDRITLK